MEECKNTSKDLSSAHCFLNTHQVCENAAATVTGWGCNHGDDKLVSLWSPDWWIFGEYVPFCHKNPSTCPHTQVITEIPWKK